VGVVAHAEAAGLVAADGEDAAGDVEEEGVVERGVGGDELGDGARLVDQPGGVC